MRAAPPQKHAVQEDEQEQTPIADPSTEVITKLKWVGSPTPKARDQPAEPGATVTTTTTTMTTAAAAGLAGTGKVGGSFTVSYDDGEEPEMSREDFIKQTIKEKFGVDVSGMSDQQIQATLSQKKEEEADASTGDAAANVREDEDDTGIQNMGLVGSVVKRRAAAVQAEAWANDDDLPGADLYKQWAGMERIESPTSSPGRASRAKSTLESFPALEEGVEQEKEEEYVAEEVDDTAEYERGQGEEDEEEDDGMMPSPPPAARGGDVLTLAQQRVAAQARVDQLREQSSALMSGLTQHSATLHSILDMQRTNEIGRRVPLIAPSRRDVSINGGIVEYEVSYFSSSATWLPRGPPKTARPAPIPNRANPTPPRVSLILHTPHRRGF